MAEALNAAVRAARRTHRIPATAYCAECGETDARLLHQRGKAWCCYACDRQALGLGPTEAHHILGKELSPVTIDIEANLHRLLSEEQLNIPEILRGKSPHNPLAWIIRVLCAIRDFGKVIVGFLDGCVQWLVRLLTALEQRFGEAWAAEIGLPPRLP